MAQSRKRSGQAARMHAAAGNGGSDSPAALPDPDGGGFQLPIKDEYAVLVMDADTHLVDWNSAAVAIFGYADSEVLGKPLSLLFPADSVREGAPEDWLARVAATGRSDEERWLVRKNGTRFWASGVAAGVRGPGGGLQGYILVLRDMTSQKLALERIRESEAKFRALLDSLPEGLFGVDQEGKCTFANSRCLEMLGYGDMDQILNQDMHVHILPDRTGGPAFPGEAAPLRAASQGGRWQGKGVFRRRDGSTFQVEFHAYPVFRGGKCAGATVVFLDVDRQKRSEAGRGTDEETARQARKMESIGRLAGGVAHDFNNALTAVTGFSELILDRLPPGDPLRDSLEEIRKGGRKLATLTQQLLSFGRRQMLQARSLDLNVFIREKQAVIQDALGRDILLIADLDPAAGPVLVDPASFEKMLLDLVGNVRSAIHGPGRMSLATRRADIPDALAARPLSLAPGAYVRLSVRDTRDDMSPEIVERILEPYGARQSLANENSGMALASAYGFIRQSGGDFLVQPGPDQGIQFDIYLPSYTADLGQRTP